MAMNQVEVTRAGRIRLAAAKAKGRGSEVSIGARSIGFLRTGGIPVDHTSTKDPAPAPHNRWTASSARTPRSLVQLASG